MNCHIREAGLHFSFFFPPSFSLSSLTLHFLSCLAEKNLWIQKIFLKPNSLLLQLTICRHLYYVSSLTMDHVISSQCTSWHLWYMLHNSFLTVIPIQVSWKFCRISYSCSAKGIFETTWHVIQQSVHLYADCTSEMAALHTKTWNATKSSSNVALQGMLSTNFRFLKWL